MALTTRSLTFATAILSTILAPGSVRAQGADPSPFAVASTNRFAQMGAKLVAPDEVDPQIQGGSVAISADGTTAIVGGAPDLTVGGARVWTRSGNVWSRQGSTLIGSGGSGDEEQGYSVALSADGNTAIVGGDQDHSGVGAAWVWIRSGGVWTQQGPRLVGSGAVGASRQGISVALSADGNTAIVGGFGDNNLVGAAWIWTRSGGVWTQQGSKRIGSGAIGIARQGISVALSGDGNTALVGGDMDNNFLGAVWVWKRSSGVWSQQGAKLVGSGSLASGADQGFAVSLSTDGNTALVGGFWDNATTGAAWVWTRSNGVWTQQGGKLVGTGAVGPAYQGVAVSISGDGNTALVGGHRDNSFQGAVWVWTRSGGVWTQQGAKLTSADAAANSFEGRSVALSANGRVAIVGGPGDNEDVGAAWVFAVRTAAYDMDGDGRTDRTVWRPTTGVWYSILSATSTAKASTWGLPTDIDVSGDYDGDGKSDIAVWRPSTGQWYIVQSSTATVRVDVWGIAGDVPLSGDVDGDGKADLAIYRPASGQWYVKLSTGGTITKTWGISTDTPLLGDFDGDGRADLVVYRRTLGVWYVLLSRSGYTSATAMTWGVSTDTPVIGDWDGDGKADAAVFRPSTGQWFIRGSSGATLVTNWGISGDVPIAGDLDGDGRSDFTVWRPSTGVWYTLYSSGGSSSAMWGVTGDKSVGRVPGS